MEGMADLHKGHFVKVSIKWENLKSRFDGNDGVNFG